jgi:hypothetical protein
MLAIGLPRDPLDVYLLASGHASPAITTIYQTVTKAKTFNMPARWTNLPLSNSALGISLHRPVDMATKVMLGYYIAVV